MRLDRRVWLKAMEGRSLLLALPSLLSACACPTGLRADLTPMPLVTSPKKPCPCSAARKDQRVPAFPGAEGNGKWAQGGRGGEVCHVTSLADSGPGSLRACLGLKGPRTVVFDLGGTITLESPLHVQHGRLTVAGQTAPGGGVTVRGYEVTFQADDIILQHVRFRAGDIRKKRCPDTGGRFTEDSLTVAGTNIIVDHVSASWGIDECLSGAPEIHHVTIQYCIMAEGLSQAGLFHGECAADLAPGGERRHSMGSLFKPKHGDGDISIHHNLYAHNDNRNPAIGTYGPTQSLSADIRNNVLYNTPSTGYTSGESRAILLNYVGNTLIFGPASREKTLWKCNPANRVTLYQADNSRDLNRNGKFDAVDQGWDMFDRCDQHAPAPLPMSPVTTHPAQEALTLVLAEAGATPWNRDAVDKRIVASVQGGTGAIIDSQDEVGGWPILAPGVAPIDTDRDGMPDDWEKNNGSNPTHADHNLDLDENGYTRLEEYLHFMARRP